ncbi:MAG: ABC transporter permease [Bacteroidota bacterium]|nr:ABC transporter permease [Bacteroidota bacterium]
MNWLLISVLRKIFKNKVNTIINLLGLTLSIVTFLIIMLWIRSERNYDHFWPSYDRMYRVALSQSANGAPTRNIAMNYSGVGPVLRDQLPEIESATLVDKDIITVFAGENSFQNINLFYTDTSFFKVFPRPLQAENFKYIFSDIHGAVLSRSMAQKLFGKVNPLNRKFKLNEGWEFFVSAVFEDFPAKSHIQVDMLVQRKALFYYMKNFNYVTGILDNGNIGDIKDRDPYSQKDWKSIRTYTYIRLKPGADIKSVEAKYAQAIKPCIKHINDAGEDVKFIFQPVGDIHLKSHLEGEIRVNGSSFRVTASFIIGLLIVIISWFNFMNLSISDYLKQAGKDNIRRVIGAGKADIMRLHTLEIFLIHTVADIVSLTIVISFLKNGQNIAGFDIPPVDYGYVLWLSVLLILAGTVLSSIYPFYKIFKSQSSIVIKDKTVLGRRSLLSREVLVVFQLAASIFLIIATCFVFKQVEFMQNQALGINMNQTMVSFSPMTMIKKPAINEKLASFKDELKRISGVKSFTTAEFVPGKAFERKSNEVSMAGKESSKTTFSLTCIDQNFFDFFSVKMLSGANFSPLSDYDSNEVIVNKQACLKLGLLNPQSAINALVTIKNATYRIIGVVDDYHHLSLKDDIEPVLFFKSLKWYRDVGFYCIKVSPVNLKTTINEIHKSWKTIYPDEPYLFSFLDDDFNAQYKEEINFEHLYVFFSILAIFIACMGLFALARLTAENKTKEIGIRKVNGAKVNEVMTLLNKDFAKWVLIAFIIATPLAWWVTHKWLQNFAYRTELSWWVFVLAGLWAVIITLCTVGWQTYRIAIRNPVESLRYE